MNESRTFLKYLKEAKIDFLNLVYKEYTITDHMKLRTAVDDMMIAFDQAVERLPKEEPFEPYTAFSEEWGKEMMKMSIANICRVFGVEKEKGETKKALINRVRVNGIVEEFNKRYDVGDDVIWRATSISDTITVTLREPAEVRNGEPTAFFNERSSYCSIDPRFIG